MSGFQAPFMFGELAPRHGVEGLIEQTETWCPGTSSDTTSDPDHQHPLANHPAQQHVESNSTYRREVISRIRSSNLHPAGYSHSKAIRVRINYPGHHNFMSPRFTA